MSVSRVVDFKGFVLLKNNNVLDVDCVVSSTKLPVSGSLSNIILKPSGSYENSVSIVFDEKIDTNIDLNITIDFPTTIDVDNICCVCGSERNNHFSSISIEYRENINQNWVKFNKYGFVPDFTPNDYSRSYFLDPVFLTQKDSYLDESGEIITIFDKDTPSGNALYEYIFTSKRKISSGKYFVEFEYENLDRATGFNYGGMLFILEADKDINVFSATNTYGYNLSYSSTALHLTRFAKTETTVQSFGPGVPSTTVVDNITFAFLIDLDNNLIKPSINGMYGDTWRNIEKTSPTQEFLICARIRNMGRGTRLRIRTTPKYQYDDLTPEFKRDLFNYEHMGWRKSNKFFLTSTKTENLESNKSFINYNYGYLDRGIIKLESFLLNANSAKLIRFDHHGADKITGYFKNKVQIDYPPLEPTSKTVLLYSIKDNKVVSETKSNSLTGEFEFKYVEMGKPYLILSYDKDEDYNAVIAGPLYPTLMPEFEENP